MPFDGSMQYIDEAEAEPGVKFPQDYKNIMSAGNGGEFLLADDEWFLYPVKDTSDKKRLSRTCNHTVLENERLRG